MERSGEQRSPYSLGGCQMDFENSEMKTER